MSVLGVGTVQATAELNMRRFSQGMKQMQTEGGRASADVTKSVEGIGTKLRSVAFIAQTVFASSLVLAARNAINSFTELETTLTKIETLVGLSAAEVRGFTDDINRLSTATGKAPKELAEALFFITSAGNRGAEALELLEISAKASAVGLGESKTIAHLASSAIAAYGKENLNASQSVNILLAAVREGKAEAADMASSLGQVLPIASEMGVTFDQVAAATAAMTRTGTDASQAATAMRSMLVGLLNPSEQAEQALERMGTSSANLRKELREKGLISVLGFLREQMVTNERAMSDVFPNVRALAGALDLMGSNAEDNIGIFDRLSGEIDLLDGAFKRTAETTETKVNKSFANMRQSVIALGKDMAPVWEQAVKDLALMVRGTSKLIINIAKLGDVARVFTDIMLTTQQLSNAIKFLGNIGLSTARNIDELNLSLRDALMGDLDVDETSAVISKLGAEIGRLDVEMKASGGGTQEQIDRLNELKGNALALGAILGQIEMSNTVKETVEETNTSVGYTKKTVNDLRSEIGELNKAIGESFDSSRIVEYRNQIWELEHLLAGLMGELKPDTSPAEVFYDMDEKLRIANESLSASLGLTDDMGESLEDVEGAITESTGAARYFSTTLGDGFANVLFQARGVEDAIKGILKQLASRVFVTGLMALFGGGLPANVSFGRAMFGGGHHTGGIVPGVGEKSISVQGGEGVFTSEQMKAMGSGGGTGIAHITVHIKGDTRLRADDLRYVIDEQVRQTVRLT